MDNSADDKRVTSPNENNYPSNDPFLVSLEETIQKIETEMTKLKSIDEYDFDGKSFPEYETALEKTLSNEQKKQFKKIVGFLHYKAKLAEIYLQVGHEEHTIKVLKEMKERYLKKTQLLLQEKDKYKQKMVTWLEELVSNKALKREEEVKAVEFAIDTVRKKINKLVPSENLEEFNKQFDTALKKSRLIGQAEGITICKKHIDKFLADF